MASFTSTPETLRHVSISKPPSAIAPYLAVNCYPPRPPSPPSLEQIIAGLQNLKRKTRPHPHLQANEVPLTEATLEHSLPANASIHTLPAELLVDIFLHTAALECGLGGSFAFWRTGAHLSQVCQHWRSLCVATPDFWRHIDASPPVKRASLFLARSAAAPLAVRISSPGGEDKDVLALLQQHTRRIRILLLRISRVTGAVRRVRPLFEVGMPALDTLEVALVDDGGYKCPPRGTPQAPVDIDFALSRARLPLLTVLIVNHAILPTPREFWRSLRVLQLRSYPRVLEGGRGLPFLLDLLVRNPGLEELYIWDTIGNVRLDGQSTAGLVLGKGGAQVRLPRLRVLSLNGNFFFLKPFLARLVLPDDIPTLDLRVLCADADAAACVLPPHFQPILDRMTPLAVTQWEYHSALTLAAPHRPWPRAAPDPPNTLSLRFEGTPRELGVPDAARVLPLVPVRTLVLRAYGGLYAQDTARWGELFDAYPTLEELQVTAFGGMLGCVSALVEALRPVPPSEGVDGRGQHTGDVRVRCPVLTHLRVHGGFSGEAKSRDFLDLLYSCMATRAQNGATVRNLDLHLMHRNKTPLSDNHRVFLRNVRIIVPVFTFKFGPSEGCRLCH